MRRAVAPETVTPGGNAMPRVTVLTAARNAAQFLRETITSVLAQSFEDFEYLIVDDELSVRDSLLSWFRMDGYAVRAVDNGLDALAAVEEGRCDLALVDIKMPGMDGIELQRRIHAIDPDIPVVVVTAFGSLDTAIAAGEFCRRAIRPDGGWIRGLYLDNRTDSFGHATSGSACAAILWLALHRATGDGAWLEPAATALDYCMKVQFVRPADANLRGAVLEKVLPPDGTDRSPYHLRDLGTIFFVTAAMDWLAQAADGR